MTFDEELPSKGTCLTNCLMNSRRKTSQTIKKKKKKKRKRLFLPSEGEFSFFSQR